VSVPVGVSVTPFESRADVIVRLAQRAEGLGLDHVHVPEGWTNDSFVLLTEMAMLTSRIGLGAGIISAWSRTPGHDRARRCWAAALLGRALLARPGSQYSPVGGGVAWDRLGAPD
jgi:hypothetical protein